MMKRFLFHILISLFLSGTFAACQQRGGGPRSWIDQPLDNDTFPLQKITLQAHASDADGVKDIEFLVDDQSIIVVNAGGERMGKVLYEWMPPGPGVYTIYAQAVDNSGNLGDAASSQITIGDQVAQIPLDEPEQPELKQDEEEEEKDIQVAEEPVEGAHAVPSQAINCRSGPSTDYDALTVLSADIPAEIVGRLSNNTWLFVSHPKNYIECWIAASIVDVIGDLNTVRVTQASDLPDEPPAEEPPETLPETPPEEPPPEPPPVEDNNPPTITTVSVSPDTIYHELCDDDVRTTTLTIECIDDDLIYSGKTRVEAAWVVGNEIGSAEMPITGVHHYEITLGPFGRTGTLSIYGSCIDGSGNWAPFDITAKVKSCIE